MPVDASFEVTSAIAITDADPVTGQVCHSLTVPTDHQLPSNRSWACICSSVLGHIVFVAYAGSRVGALDVSNSDAVSGQDPVIP
jgi:hypothetical protein